MSDDDPFLPPLIAEDHLTHVVQIRVTYHEIVSPYTPADREPRHTLLMVAQPPNEGVDLDELRRTIERGFRPDFLLDQNVHHTSWGADATIVEFVLQATAAGIVGGAAWDALKAVGKRLVKLHRESKDISGRPIDEEEAKGWARQLAVRHFPDLDTVGLTVRRLRLEPPGALVVLGGGDGSVITVVLDVLDGLVALGSVEREYPD